MLGSSRCVTLHLYAILWWLNFTYMTIHQYNQRSLTPEYLRGPLYSLNSLATFSFTDGKTCGMKIKYSDPLL